MAPSGFIANILYEFFLFPCVLHVPHISSSSVLESSFWDDVDFDLVNEGLGRTKYYF
jgi:hypothetical protein